MKKNENSSCDESVNEPTTKPASEDLNMSAGAEMLIERMKTNPEDFKYGGKFYRVVQALTDGQTWVSKRDRAALREVYEETVVEADFSAWVYNEIFNPKEQELASNYVYAQAQGSKSQMQRAMLQGVTDPMAIYGGNNVGVVGTGLVSSPGSWTVAASNTSGTTHVSDSMISQIKNKLGL